MLLLADPAELRGDAAEMFRRMQIEPAVALNAEKLRERGREVLASDLLLDAILGTGFRPPVSGLYADAIAAMNASGTPVVAVDIPSGADADAMAPDSRVSAGARRCSCDLHRATSGTRVCRTYPWRNRSCTDWIAGGGNPLQPRD